MEYQGADRLSSGELAASLTDRPPTLPSIEEVLAPAISIEGLSDALLSEQLKQKLAEAEEFSRSYLNQVADDLYHEYRLEPKLNDLLNTPRFSALLEQLDISADALRGQFWQSPQHPFDVLLALGAGQLDENSLQEKWQHLQPLAKRNDKHLEDVLMDTYSHFAAALLPEEHCELERLLEARAEIITEGLAAQGQALGFGD